MALALAALIGQVAYWEKSSAMNVWDTHNTEPKRITMRFFHSITLRSEIELSILVVHCLCESFAAE
jgi:hypothetical protein